MNQLLTGKANEHLINPLQFDDLNAKRHDAKLIIIFNYYHCFYLIADYLPFENYVMIDNLVLEMACLTAIINSEMAMAIHYYLYR